MMMGHAARPSSRNASKEKALAKSRAFQFNHDFFAAQEAEKALSAYEAAQRAFHANRERLKEERLAREAAACGAKFHRDVG
jgi:hypothetical protein